MRARLQVLTAREASIFACLVDTVVSPVPPLPPVAQTDAAGAFDAWLARAPKANRIALRAMLYAAEAGPVAARSGGRLRRLDPERRLEFIRRAERTRLPGARQLAEALRGAAAIAYYGDADVMRILGYDAAERVSTGAAAREARG